MEADVVVCVKSGEEWIEMLVGDSAAEALLTAGAPFGLPHVSRNRAPA